MTKDFEITEELAAMRSVTGTTTGSDLFTERKIKGAQQMRMKKELREQQIVEAKQKKQQEAANARKLEAEKRKKEKEMQRLQAVMLKHKEKERLKQQKMDEIQLNKERKLQLRRLELEKAKALKKPNEDMCLADLKGSTLSDCLIVLQFLHSFGKVLGLDNLNDLDLSVLQEGFLNTWGSMGKVQDLLVSMVSSAVQDPGIPAGHRSKTCLGEELTDVEISRDNVSEILQIYMEAHCD
ncbi:bromodomain adjacent to zinc finger domain protein 2B isoform X2 [Pleuronectes platessa]|uniref:bromodomain adjacent to zinc finger domain protein 2B isoform X2 n=1 Tax=Pleuronectes platessa TaxID=8262 RepID=UPI00232A2F40|nr:bromodomain adjacent to zinc finger domain protein 2B isoform X2 [Pleuronectes platessa]